MPPTPVTNIPATTIGRLDGHVALITGGNGGIGLGMALGLVPAGASVVLWGRNEEKNAAAAEKIRAVGGQVATLVRDVRTARTRCLGASPTRSTPWAASTASSPTPVSRQRQSLSSTSRSTSGSA